ncbi:carbohydrate-binding module family 20 domain-containing protein [Kitasatospora terrestris]|uniref:alpha-amylase n=1 Tax=Kitasatospora terrestris TaxID=258051 RepID=A0ABP9EIA8_9ACTN
MTLTHARAALLGRALLFAALLLALLGGTVARSHAADSGDAAPLTSFRATATTVWGQGLFVVGDLAELGAWDPAKAVPLSTDAGTYPLWTGTAPLPPDTAVQYKYLKKNPDGTVIWEGGDNRTGVTPPTGAPTFTDTWQETAPPCLSYSSDWRYTFVTNACAQPYSVQLTYVSGTSSPCRYTEPGDVVTFAGYGTNGNYVTQLRLC